MPAGVPDTDTFSMQDVVNEIGAGDDLVELFSLATGLFDPAYVGDKTNLLNFRNYDHNPIPPVNLVETWVTAPDGDLLWTRFGGTTIGAGNCTFTSVGERIELFVPFSGGDLLVTPGGFAGNFGLQVTVSFGDGVPIVFQWDGVTPGPQTIVGTSASTAMLKIDYTNAAGGTGASLLGTWNFDQI